MRLASSLLALLLLLPFASCKHSRSKAIRLNGITEITGMVADPARERAYIGDSQPGEVHVVSTRDGSDVETLQCGATIGGLTLDCCLTKLFVSVTGGRRIDIFDADTLARVGTVPLVFQPYALTCGVDGHVIAVTTGGLLDVDTATAKTTTLQKPVALDAILVTDRGVGSVWIAEPDQGFTRVERFDLVNGGAPVEGPAGVLAGAPIALGLSYAEDVLYVAVRGQGGVYALEAATLALGSEIVVGPDLVAACLNPTATRMYFSHGDTTIDSINLDLHASGATYDSLAPIAERGLSVAADGLGLLTHEEDATIESYELFDVHLRGPGAVRQKRTYVAQIEGEPFTYYYLFASAEPGYVYLDPPTSNDPRFLDLALGAGFQVLGCGTLDGTGHATFTGTIGDAYTGEPTIVFQVALQPQPRRINTVIGNPLMVRFLPPECSN
jgi:hypothetical protein